ncbi:MAG: ABC-2 transporter permease [Clostridia bacterium]|nr:ABC-2 transporter permease [Clostridia bacterium]MBR2926782.1 ABC-2 transporter permease [Clostridia bacterium]
MQAIYRKEMRSYFINPIGYVYLGIFLVFSALLCCYTTIIAGTYSTTSYFTYLMFSFVILIPLLTMRLFAEERKLRTEQLLLTAPVTITGMVLGKYFAALTMFVGGILLSCINFIPLYVISFAENADTENVRASLMHIGPVTGQIIGSVLALILLGAALIAVGTFISALSENQLSAAVISVGTIAGMVLLNILNLLKDSDGQPLIAFYPVRLVIDWVSVVSRFGAFGNGVFDYASLLYYASLAFVFLFLTVRVYEKRRWG